MRSILSKYSNLTQRIIAALIGAIIIVGSLISGMWYFFIVFLAIGVVTQLEFYKLVGLDGMLPLKTYGTICGIFLFTLSFLIESGQIEARYYALIFPVVACVYLIYLYRKQVSKPFRGIAFTFLGIIYVMVPFSLLNVVIFEPGAYTFILVLGSMLILWSNDTGAYFTGVQFGRRKLFERVSPKKSWEGFVGGLLFSIGMSLLIDHYTDVLQSWQWISIAFIISIGGTYGDLVESLFKRSIEIKDSGRLIPGHGGFLDRFDGLLLSVPFIVAFLKIF
ncbi:phosphatidate cytidylyltransferase [Fulvivirga sedimenti]|uniref:Phosphatidate cytidylyltransferase n=1 Tax=Fulvivirga sedimenti TaxID=2879465 RepID=A0A9X1HWB5_9BACT|nr:phosphatidate cytidylyltransferase [Fulvivirga sedimenti]MCA6078248.1 phosphatidate cytidylyltransferase [Fulvivirga sedimenti]